MPETPIRWDLVRSDIEAGVFLALGDLDLLPGVAPSDVGVRDHTYLGYEVGSVEDSIVVTASLEDEVEGVTLEQKRFLVKVFVQPIT